MILCPINGDWCNKYVFDEDWKLSCDCELIKEGEEVTVNEYGGSFRRMKIKEAWL